jgi:hypothetical protein
MLYSARGASTINTWFSVFYTRVQHCTQKSWLYTEFSILQRRLHPTGFILQIILHTTCDSLFYQESYILQDSLQTTGNFTVDKGKDFTFHKGVLHHTRGSWFYTFFAFWKDVFFMRNFVHSTKVVAFYRDFCILPRILLSTLIRFGRHREVYILQKILHSTRGFAFYKEVCNARMGLCSPHGFYILHRTLSCYIDSCILQGMLHSKWNFTVYIEFYTVHGILQSTEGFLHHTRKPWPYTGILHFNGKCTFDMESYRLQLRLERLSHSFVEQFRGALTWLKLITIQSTRGHNRKQWTFYFWYKNKINK